MDNRSRKIKLVLVIHLTLILYSIGNAQTKATFIEKTKFSFPMNGNYCILITEKNDSLFSYYSIFNRLYDNKTTGLYIEISSNKIKFESYLKNGKLNGLYRRYYSSGELKSYGKYNNNLIIENYILIYNTKMELIKIDRKNIKDTI